MDAHVRLPPAEFESGQECDVVVNAPKTPRGGDMASFGLAMGWGSGSASARERMATITREHLKKIGMTRGLAIAWRNFYDEVHRRNPLNPSAAGRRDLMERVIELLTGDPP